MVSIKKQFLPKIEVLFRKGYSIKETLLDIAAALSITMVSLPLSIAFAIAAGASPQQGIVCGVVLGFFVSLFGGSRHAIAGPTGAFVVIIFDILARKGLNGLGTSMILAGVILILFGVLRLGNFIRFIPFPLIVGFTTALASLILLGQLKDVFGLPSMKEPGFLKMVIHYMTHFKKVEPFSVLASAITFLTAFIFKSKLPKWPWAVLSIVATTLAMKLLGISVPTLGSKFGSLSLFPWPKLPTFQIDMIPSLFSDGFTIAALAGIEALLCCLVADAMTGTRHRSNIELIAHGLGNVACGILGGIPGTNAISRTGANIRAGGRSPVAGILHAVFLALIFAFLGPLCALIPLASLASVLVLIAWHMAAFDRFFEQFKAPIPDVIVMLATFLITIFINITVAVQIGMIMAAFLFVFQQSKRFTLLNLKEAKQEQDDMFNLEELPKDTDVYEMQGPLFFGAIDRLKVLLKQDLVPKYLILRMQLITEIDASGMHTLKTLQNYLKQHHCQIYLVGVQSYVKKAMDKYKLVQFIGEEHFCKNMKDAISKIKMIS